MAVTHRTHLLPGAAVVTGGVLLLVSAAVPWVSVSLPQGGLLGGLVQVDVRRLVGEDALRRGLDPGLRAGMVVSAVVLLVAGVLLVTVPRLRVLWRAVAAAGLVVPVLAGFWAWKSVSGVGSLPARLTGSGLDEVLRSFLASGPEARSLVVLSPAVGMWLASFGLVAVVLGLLWPGREIASP